VISKDNYNVTYLYISQISFNLIIKLTLLLVRISFYCQYLYKFNLVWYNLVKYNNNKQLYHIFWFIGQDLKYLSNNTLDRDNQFQKWFSHSCSLNNRHLSLQRRGYGYKKRNVRRCRKTDLSKKQLDTTS